MKPTFIDQFQILAQMIEICKVELVQIGRILYRNEIFPYKWLICDQILPEVRFDVELFNCLHASVRSDMINSMNQILSITTV